MPHRRAWGLALAAGVLAVVVYGSTLEGPFVYDDIKYVRDNAFVQDPSNAGRLWTTPYPPDRPDLGLYRPVTAATYMADFWRAGSDPGAFHVTNALLHGAASALAVFVVLAFGGGLVAAALTGAFFAVHPVHTEAVAWIVGRAEVLAALGCFAACLTWLRFVRTREATAYAATLVLYFLALGAKETAAPLPLVLGLASWLGVDRDRSRAAGATAAGVTAQLWPLAGFACALVPYVALRVYAIGRFSMLEATTAFVGEPVATRVLSAIAIIGEYARLCLVPLHLRVDYGDFRFDTAAAGPVVAGVLALGLILGAIVMLRHRAPRAAFWVGWFLLFVLVFSNLVIPIGAVMAERFVYVASLGPCALAGIGLAHLLTARRPPALRLAAASGAAVVLASFAAATVERNRDWQDTIRLFTAEIVRSPSSEKAHLNLAAELWDRGKKGGHQSLLDQADEVFRKGIAVRGSSRRTMTGDHVRLVYFYGNFLQEQGRAADAVRQYEQLGAWLRQYPALIPEVGADYFVWYGAALEARGQTDDALAQYRTALERRPGWIVPLRNIGQTRMQQRRYPEAVRVYREALAADATFAIGYVNLALCLLQLAERAEARSVLDTFTRSVSETAENAYYQGFVAQRLGLIDEAASRYERALQLDPGRADARTALASLARSSSDGAGAARARSAGSR